MIRSYVEDDNQEDDSQEEQGSSEETPTESETSEEMEFELAASLRDRIRALAQVQSNQGINPRTVSEADVISLHLDAGQACVQVFFIRANQNWGNVDFYPRVRRRQVRHGRLVVLPLVLLLLPLRCPRVAFHLATTVISFLPGALPSHRFEVVGGVPKPAASSDGVFEVHCGNRRLLRDALDDG